MDNHKFIANLLLSRTVSLEFRKRNVNNMVLFDQAR